MFTNVWKQLLSAMITSSSLAVKCALLGSSSHLRSMVRIRCRMEGSVVPARTDCPVMSITNVDRKCLRWSADKVSAEGTATAWQATWKLQ